METDKFQLHPWRLKLNRAVEISNQLKHEIGIFESSNPHEIITNSWDGHILEITLQTRELVSDKWSIYVGDILHNLRSALDSIIYGIFESKLRSKGEEIPSDLVWRIEFPIKMNPCNISELSGFQEYAGPVLIEDVSELQPYRYLNEFVKPNEKKIVTAGHPLALLNHLSNVDKHRKLHFIYYYLNTYAIALPEGQKIESGTQIASPISNRQYKFQFNISGGLPEMVPSFIPHFQIGIEDSRNLLPNYSIRELLDFLTSQVNFILERLEYHLEPDFDPK